MTGYDDQTLINLLRSSSNIALVGHSSNPERASFVVSRYLREQGFKVFPVNPMLDEVDGLRVYPSLDALPVKIDIVDVFRQADFLPQITREAVAVGAGAVWGQLEVIHPEAGNIAKDAGVLIVMDRCIKVEHTRLFQTGKEES